DYALQNIGLEEPIGSDYVTGKGEESFPSMVDELTRKIKSNFQLSQDKIANDIDREVGMISTSSPEAYRYYSEGRKYHYTGEYRESIPFMQKAIEIDPSFAMAYRSMAMSFGNLGYGVEERKHLQKAFELTNRLSDRERYLIQGDFYRTEKIYDKAIEAYDKLLELYPDDLTGNNNSALTYLNLEDWDKAIERYKVAVGLRDPAIQSHTGLAGSYAAKGLYDKCEEVFMSYLQDISESINIRRFLVRTLILQRNYELAQAVADETTLLFPDHYRSIWIQGSVFFFKGELLRAEEEFQMLLGIEDPMAQLSGRERLSALYLLQGRFKEAISQEEKGLELAKELGEIDSQAGFLSSLSYCNYRTGNHERALEELEKAWNIYIESKDLPMQIFVVFAKGLGYVKMEAMSEAQRTADEIKKLVDQSMNRKLIRYYD
nr:tetratricopeptide repeat protein [bacterium]